MWCDDAPPQAPLAQLAQEERPLILFGGEVDAALPRVAEVRRLYPHAVVALLVERISQDEFAEALRHGVATVIRKSASSHDLIASLRLACAGTAAFPSELIDRLAPPEATATRDGDATLAAPRTMEPCARGEAGALRSPPLAVHPFGSFSEREMDVVRHLVEGLSNKEIARELGISEATIKVHVKAILRKSKVRNRTQVAMWASRHQPIQARPPSIRAVAPVMDVVPARAQAPLAVCPPAGWPNGTPHRPATPADPGIAGAAATNCS